MTREQRRLLSKAMRHLSVEAGHAADRVASAKDVSTMVVARRHVIDLRAMIDRVVTAIDQADGAGAVLGVAARSNGENVVYLPRAK